MAKPKRYESAVPELRENELVMCCFDGCPHRSIVKVKRPAGWANVCHTHYIQFANDDVPAHIKRMSARAWSIEREPGADEGE